VIQLSIPRELGAKQLDAEDAYSALFVPPFPARLHDLSLKHRERLKFTISFSFTFSL
jgi:hypothetical protein